MSAPSSEGSAAGATTGTRAFPAARTRLTVFGAACWALSAVFFVGQALGQAASARPYSLATNLISDLGNTACAAEVCSPLHGLVNAVFLATGALHALGITTYAAWPRRRLGYVGVQLVAIAGVGLAVAALRPENVDPAGHARGALAGLVALNLTVIFLGLAVVGAVRWIGVMGVTAGVAGFAGLALFLSVRAIPMGLTERIADYPGAAVLVVFGVVLLVTDARRPRVST